MSEIKISKEVNEIKEKISKLNLGQVSELIDSIKQEYNIQEQAVVQSVATTPTSEKSEEKGNNVSVKLLDLGPQKVQIYNIVKSAIKELTEKEINIIEAKKITEKEDKIIFENIAKEKAGNIKKQLEEKGATVEIK